MGRYANIILIAVGVVAAAVLTAEGVLNRNFLNTELSSLLCVIAAVPPVIAAIRIENARRIEATTQVIVDETQRLKDTFTEEIRALGDRLGKHQLEAVLGTMYGMETRTKMEAAEERARALRWSGTDTGPFRIPQ